MARIAVCICTCDRTAMLEVTLAVLARIDLPGPGTDLALVVVDNHPDGRARALCERRRPSLPLILHFVDEPRRGVSFARNRAVAEALALNADHVAFIDDDDEPDVAWLTHLVARQQETDADLVFGTWRLPAALDLPPGLEKVRYFEPMCLERRNRYGLPAWAGTYNVMLSARMLRSMASRGPVFRPMFARSGGGDMDLFIRADRQGFRHAIAARSVVARVWEPQRLTRSGVVRRGFRFGCSRFHLAQAHLPPTRVRRLRWQAVRSLCMAPLRLPLAAMMRPSGGLRECVRTAQAAGVIYAASGRQFTYYGGTSTPPGRESPTAA